MWWWVLISECCHHQPSIGHCYHITGKCQRVPARIGVQCKVSWGRGTNCCQLSLNIQVMWKIPREYCPEKSLLPKRDPKKLVWFCCTYSLDFLVVCYSGKCQRFRHPWVVKDGWTVANRVHLKLSCLGKYICVYFFSLYNKLTFKFDYVCMRIGLSVSCQIFSSCVEASSWYIFSLAPSTLVDHQLIWKIVLDLIFIK